MFLDTPTAVKVEEAVLRPVIIQISCRATTPVAVIAELRSAPMGRGPVLPPRQLFPRPR